MLTRAPLSVVSQRPLQRLFCTERAAAPDGAVNNQFTTSLPQSDCGRICHRLAGFPPLGVALFQHPLFTSLPRSACLYPLSTLPPTLPSSPFVPPPTWSFTLPLWPILLFISLVLSHVIPPTHTPSIRLPSIPRLPDLIYRRRDSVSQMSGAREQRGVGGRMSECVGIRA